MAEEKQDTMELIRLLEKRLGNLGNRLSTLEADFQDILLRVKAIEALLQDGPGPVAQSNPGPPPGGGGGGGDDDC